MKPDSNTFMLLLMFAIGISAIAMYLSFSTIASRYIRMTDNERDPQLRVSEAARVFLSDDPPIRSHANRAGLRRRS